MTVTSGAGNDSLRNHVTHVLIEAGADDDTIEAYVIDKDSSSYTTLRGGASNDHIDNHVHHVLIEGGTGNDTLGNYTGDDNGIHEQYEADYSTMLGGDGDDYIDNRGDNSSIDGGKDTDKIYGGSGNDTLWGNAGNDSLYGGAGNETFIYKPGEGIDKIFDYASGDMLKILKTNGKDGGTFSKGNLTLAISGGGSVIFDGVSKGDVININGTNHTINSKTFK